MKTFPGLIDRVVFPDQLTASVVEPTPDPRIHGYAVQADLGHSAGFMDVAFLALTGELPTDSERAALSRALVWLAPLHVGEGPAHAAVLARVAGAPDEVVPAVSSVALGQHIAAELQALQPLFAWLSAPQGPPPASVVEPAPTAAQQAAWERLCDDSLAWFGPERSFSGAAWRRQPAAWALLHRLGLTDTARLIALGTLARLPTILAEAACTAPGSVMRYPTNTPDYRYVEEA